MATAREEGALTERGESAREGVPGGHPPALSAAVLRIGASLDIDTVPTEVVDSARSLAIFEPTWSKGQSHVFAAS